jgi:ribosomal protein S18 acetylase RimI-like enzyme
MISIRRAIGTDAPRIAALAERTFREAFGSANRPEDMALHVARSYGVAQQSAEIAHPAIITLLAEEAGEAIGYAQLWQGMAPPAVTGPRPMELRRFYVDQRWHGRGVAQQLMAAAVQEARLQEAETLWLGVWEKNPRAEAFYRKYGFVTVGSQTFLLGTDPQSDLVMALPLNR